MTISQALAWATQKIKSASSALEAEVLLSFVLKKPKEFLYTHPEKILTAARFKKLSQLARRRHQGEPVAYLTNRKEFYGLDFYVDKRVLIPRPETELLVEEVIRSTNNQQPSTITMADIGTGSGCIAIAWAKNLPKTTIYAVDISKPALAVAKKNAKKHKAKIKFFQGNLLTPVKNHKIDIIVANLPYLAKTNLSFEPKKAVIAQKNGLALYEKMFQQVKKLKYQPKYVCCEIDPRQTDKFKKMVLNFFPDALVKIKKDLAGLDRVALIKL